MLIGPLGAHIRDMLIRNPYIFVRENAFENVVCEMSAICLDLNVLSITWQHVVIGFG